MQHTFWMVLGAGVPVHRHGTAAMAKQEAERLARVNPEQEFCVLQSIAICRKSDVRWEKCEVSEDFEIPF